MVRQITMKAFFGHIRNILVHKWWVFYYARKFGIPWRGFMHDWSKFHPTEFWESVKYYRGDESPIPVCKAANGVSRAWQHHKGHNPHHYEYWTDNYDKGNVTCHRIPYKYVMEMLADWFAAGRTYRGKSFTVRQEVEWWREKKKNPNLAINPALIVFIDEFMNDVEYFNSIDWVKDEHNRQVLKHRLATHYEVNKQLNKS